VTDRFTWTIFVKLSATLCESCVLRAT